MQLVLTRLFELVEAIDIEKTHRIIMNTILCVFFFGGGYFILNKTEWIYIINAVRLIEIGLNQG